MNGSKVKYRNLIKPGRYIKHEGCICIIKYVDNRHGGKVSLHIERLCDTGDDIQKITSGCRDIIHLTAKIAFNSLLSQGDVDKLAVLGII